MIKLTIGNSTCKIEGLSVKQFSELKKLLSYQVNASAAYFSGGHNNTRYLLGRRGDFPTGLLYIVKAYLKHIKEEFSVVETRVKPVKQLILAANLGFSPYKEQVEAADACYNHQRGIVVAPTGVGKSVIAALIINRLQVPTLVVVPSLELRRQLITTLQNIFGEENVGSLHKGRYIAVENVDALDPNEPLVGYDCVIIDEFHHSGAKTYRKLNEKAWNDVFYKFGLTATPFRSQEDERLLLESVLSKVIYRIEYEDAVKKGYIVPMDAYYLELPKTEVKGDTWGEVYKELVVSNKVRNSIIAKLLIALHQNKISTLCLVKEIAHGNAITKLTGGAFANGQNDECEVLIQFFNDKHLRVLTGTTGVLGEGVDTKPCQYVIIAGLGKSKNAFMQQVGRAFRVSPGKERATVIIFKDNSHKWSKAHFNAQVKILKEEYGVTPTRLGYE